mgnify:CR=1 FL=1
MMTQNAEQTQADNTGRRLVRCRIQLTADQREAMQKAADGRPLERFMGLCAVNGLKATEGEKR